MYKLKGYGLVFLQFLLILIILLPLGTPAKHLYPALAIIVFGGIVGILALYENRLFNIRPDIKKDAMLVTSGIYAYVRHPMYTSVLLMMLGVTLLYPEKFVLISYALLIVTLLVKLLYEESLWRTKSDEYIEYMKGTKRLLPFIF